MALARVRPHRRLRKDCAVVYPPGSAIQVGDGRLQLAGEHFYPKASARLRIPAPAVTTASRPALLRVLPLSRMAGEEFTRPGLRLWQPQALVTRCRPGRCR
jgi:hypothetical protein